MIENDFVFKGKSDLPESGKIGWKAPSNIALVKYWGKRKHQIPENPSVSFTLDACATKTYLTYKKITAGATTDFEVYLDDKLEEAFKPKITTFFERIVLYCPYLQDYRFKIETSNTFPHSSGIASSASGMAALSLCIMELEKAINPEMEMEYFHQKASFLARLGSGSAARSINGGLIQWGQHQNINGSSDLFGITYPFETHSVFENFHDTILLIHKGQKQVSSTVGHNLMHGHPYAERRFQQAFENLDRLKPILKQGDLEAFIGIVESEALTLHAMMMTSMPYFILMKPNTLEVIQKIWEFREATQTPICFTLDAGANVHVLYPESAKEKAYQFIKEALVEHCEQGHYICDRVGKGAKSLLI